MSIANPKITAAIRAAGVTAGLTPEKLLFVGQLGAAATANTGDLQLNVLDGDADGLFGQGSPLALAVNRARARNSETQFDAIGLSHALAVAQSTGTITFAGTATETGELVVIAGSNAQHRYKIPVTSGDTAAVVSGAVAAAINGVGNDVVTAADVLEVLTLTARDEGKFGDTIGIKVEGSVAGITTVVVGMSGGGGDPLLTGVLDVADGTRYQGIVWQYSEDVSEVKAFLDARFNVANDVLDGVAFVSLTDTFANHLLTLAPLNSPSLSMIVNKLVATPTHAGPAVMELPFVKAAEFAAIRALRRTEEAVLGGLVISRSARDSFGGPWQNSKPYFNTPLPSLAVPDPGKTFSRIEVNQLQAAGGWVIDANRAGTAVIAGEVVTTYKTDPAGNPDPTFTFLNYVDTSTASREYISNNTRAHFPQYRATGGALINGVDSANEASVAAYVAELYSDLGDLGLVNTGVGSIDGNTVDYDKLFRQNLTVSLNPVTGKFLVSCKLYIVVQLRGITYDLAIAFEV